MLNIFKSKAKKEKERIEMENWHHENRIKEELKTPREKKWYMVMSILYTNGHQEINTLECNSEEHAKTLKKLSREHFQSYLEGKLETKAFEITGNRIDTLINMDFIVRINFTINSEY